MRAQKTYIREKRFKELFRLMRRDDIFIRETAEKTYIITVPNPVDEDEYVLSAYRGGDNAKEFVDLGRCVKQALDLGATSIHFRDPQDNPLKFHQ